MARPYRLPGPLFAAALLLALAGAPPAVAQGFQEAAAAYRKGDYRTAHRGFLGPAERGNVLAQLALGVMYDEGRGVGRNDAEAARWFRPRRRAGQSLGRRTIWA